MEIVAGENACYRLSAFISLKMELSWRSKPVGRIRPNLPFYQIYTKYLIVSIYAITNISVIKIATTEAKQIK